MSRIASPLSHLDGLRYGLLGFPVAFAALPLYVHLPQLYASQVGLPVAAIGGVLLLVRVIDGVADPLIGRLLDTLAARAPATAWTVALVAAIALAAGCGALFFPPQAGSGAALVWLGACLLPTSIAYSTLAITHEAWGTRLGGDASQRMRVAAWREGAGLAGVVAAAVLPSLAGLPATWALLAAALAIALLLLAGAPRGAAPTPPTAPPPGRRAGSLHAMGAPWRDAAFRDLLRTYLVNASASAIPATLVLFYVRDALRVPAWEPAFLAAYFSAAFAATPLWLRAAARWGLLPVWRAAMLASVLAFACVPFIAPGHPLPFLAVCIASGLALGADLAIPGALMTECVQRAAPAAAGAYAGWWTLVTKLSLALAAGAALPLLGWAGYAPGVRDPMALDALVLTYAVLPCVLKLAAAASLTLTQSRTELCA